MFIGVKLGIIFVLPKNVLIKNSFSFDLAQNNRKPFVNCILYCNFAQIFEWSVFAKFA